TLYWFTLRSVAMTQALNSAGPVGRSISPSRLPPPDLRPKSNVRRKTSTSLRRTMTYPGGAGTVTAMRSRTRVGVGAGEGSGFGATAIGSGAAVGTAAGPFETDLAGRGF